MTGLRKALWMLGVRRYSGTRHFLLAWPLAAVLILTLYGFGALGFSRLVFNNAPEVFYPADARAVLIRDRLRSLFPNDEALVVVFQGPDLFGRDFLQGMDRFSESIGRHPLVDRVISVTTAEKIAPTPDGFTVGPLVDPRRLDVTGETLRERLLSDRFAPKSLISTDGKTLAAVVRPKPLTESSQRLDLKIATLSAISAAGLMPYYAGDAGPITVDVAMLQAILDDSATFVPLTVGIGLLLLWWVIGRLAPMVIGAVAMGCVVLPSIATIAFVQQPYTMATAILPSLLAAYTIATLLHFFSAVQQGHGAGLSQLAAIDRAIGETRKPALFNVLTTGAGLLSLLLVPIPPIQAFGAIGALGTALVFPVVYLLVPALLLRWSRTRWPVRASGMGRLSKAALKLAFFSMRRRKGVLIVAGLLVLATVPIAMKVEVESDALAFFRADHPLRKHNDLVEAKLSGTTTLEVLMQGDRPGSLQQVKTLKAVLDLQKWMEDQKEIDRAISFADLVVEMNWAMNEGKPASRTVPASDRLLQQYLLVYDGRDLYELVNRDFDEARILLSLNVHGSTQIQQTIEKIRAKLAAHDLPGVKAADVGGNGRLFADQAQLLVDGQLKSFAGAFLQIALFMALLWRSATASAVCLVPNLAPLFFIFVIMGAYGIDLDLATVMIASVVLGITVDDTIHLYHGYTRRVKKGLSPVLAIARGFQTTGRAVLATAVLLIAQFGLLAMSDFVPTSNFGLMTAVGLFAGQAFELLLLPALLLFKDGRRYAANRPTVRMRTLNSSINPSPSSASRPLRDPRLPSQRYRVLVCRSRACREAGSESLARHWIAACERNGLAAAGSGATVTRTECLGACELAPAAQVYPDGVYYCKLDHAGVDTIVSSHLLHGDVVEPLALRPILRQRPPDA